MVLSLKVLGDFAIRAESGTPLSLPTRKTRALLGYLAVHADTPQRRDRLMGLLWSDRGERQARHSLNQALLSIRRLGSEAGVALLAGDTEHVMLRTESIEVDLVRFRTLSIDDPIRAAELYDGPFLDGLSIPDPAFEEWLGATQSEFHALACHVLERVADKAVEDSDNAEAIAVARRLVALDPLREDAHRRLIKALYESGDRAGALRQYQACANILRKELQVEPDAVTRALADEIGKETSTTHARAAQNSGQQTDALRSLPEKPSIALMPFANLSADPDQDYLAEGIRLDLQTKLVRIPGLFLVATRPVNERHAAGESATQIVAELGVRYVLEGAVQRSDDRIRITAQVTDAQLDRVIWAEQYDRVFSDSFTVQDDITAEILTALDIKLLRRERFRFVTTVSKTEARDYFYRGLSDFYANTKSDNDNAIRNFKKVAELEPDSPVGPTYLCLCYWRDAFTFSPASRDEALETALFWADKSITFGKTNGLAHIVLASNHLRCRRYDDALSASYEAFHLRPNCPVANASLAQILLYCGHHDEAIATIKVGMRIAIIYPPWFANVLAAAYRESGNLDSAIEISKETFERHPNDLEAGLSLCSSLQVAKRHRQANEIAQKILAIDPIFSVEKFMENQYFRDGAAVERLSRSLLEAGLPH